MGFNYELIETSEYKFGIWDVGGLELVNFYYTYIFFFINRKSSKSNYKIIFFHFLQFLIIVQRKLINIL